ncbi:MAG: polysaccharide deacetylase family protein [Hyphomicrobium sp.]
MVEIDAAGGPIFGAFTKQEREPAFLKPKEVVLTFDDGPMPWITRSILDTLDDYCAHATFFSVGRMALAYPDVVRDIAARGHTLASHTMTHPFNMPRMSAARAQDEIERGFAAVSAAAGGPIAPFFRFPGLADSSALLDYLQQRGIAAFTVDIVSNDSYIASPGRLAERTLAEIERANGGIVLFHDIKRATAKALPEILKALKARGYTIVHLTATTPVAPKVELFADYSAKIAASKKDAGAAANLLPFYGAVGPVATMAATNAEPITRLAPAPRPRLKAAASPHIANSDGTATSASPWRPHIRPRRKGPLNELPADVKTMN